MTTSIAHRHAQLSHIAKGLRHTTGSRTYVPGIDGLRALAVIAVMLFHLDPSFLPGGFSGVDVFFVISGYVVSTSLSRDVRKSFGHFLLAFYARRIIRIVPALVACLLVTSLFANLFIPESWLSTANRDTGLYAFFGLSNFALIWTTDGYFSPRTEFNPFVHTWSLAIEEQFYLVFPLLFYVWLTTRDKRPAIQRTGNSLLPILLVASLAYAAEATHTNPASAYYLLPSRFWELASGAWLFQLQSQGYATLSSRGAARLVLLLGAILVVVAFTFSDERAFPYPWALAAVAGSTLLIVGVSSPVASGLGISRLLDIPPLVLVGRLSYSLYLWHWPVNVLFRWTVGLEGYLQMVSAVAITTLLASSSFYFLERPIRRSQTIRSLPRLTIILGGIAIIVAGWGLSAKMFTHQRHLSLSVTRDKEIWYPEAWATKATAEEPGACASEVRWLKQAGIDIVVFKPKSCKSVLAADHRLFVVGDSHAGAYSTLLRLLTERQGIEVRLYTRGGCAVAQLIEPPSSTCSEYAQSNLADIAGLARPGDVLFLPGLRMYRIVDQWAVMPERTVLTAQEGDKAIRDRTLSLKEAKRQLAALDGLGLKIVIEGPKPILPAPPFRCSDWFNSDNPICHLGLSISRAELIDRRRPMDEALMELQTFRPDIHIWNPFETLCPGTTCSAFDGSNKPLFFDGDHLSAHGNRFLYPSFEAMLLGMWGVSP